METYQTLLVFLIGFAIVALASKQIAQFFVKARLPLITGFLFTGILAGPYVLGLIPAGAVENLRFVDEFSLAFIAFAAGSELCLTELRGRLRSIKWVTVAQVIATFVLGSVTTLALAGFVPFMQEMSFTGRIAVSLLAGAILVARSPSSAIAIVNELRAKGPFTQMVLGVTMVTDIVVIVLFATSSSIADGLLTDVGLDLGFVALLATDLLLAAGAGYVLGRVLRFILARHVRSIIKIGAILLVGYGAFLLSHHVRVLSHRYLPAEILLEPLLVCMIAGFMITNYTPFREEFDQILHDAGPPIYVAFFTLTGASLALDLLVKTWAIALALFAVRLVSIFAGSFSGGAIAGDPPRFNRVSWMAFVTQAGVGLGLAKEVAVEFPGWGSAFATMIISVIVVNQIVGPPLFKWAVNLVKESRLRAETPDFDGVRDAIIFGYGGQALALAHQLHNHGWEVKVASPEITQVEAEVSPEIDLYAVPDLSLDTLHSLNAGQAEAIVTLLSDEENYRVCELAYEHFGIENLVVRLNDRAHRERFRELGALVVDPTTALVGLMDHFVRSPAATSLLLGMTEDRDVIDLEVGDPDLFGLPLRDLCLPLDAHILALRRDGHVLIPHDYTRLQPGDWVTVVGSLEDLEQMKLLFDA